MKITDSPGAMLAIPLNETAAANDSELSSTFHPVRATGAPADVGHLEPVRAHRAVAAGPRRHFGNDQLARRPCRSRRTDLGRVARRNEGATNTDGAQRRDRRVVEAGTVVERRERCDCRSGAERDARPARAAGVEEVDGISAGAEADAPA